MALPTELRTREMAKFIENPDGEVVVRLAAGKYRSSNATLTAGQVGTPLVDVNGNTQVVGNIADNGADSNAPVKVGGKYNASAPTYADGDRGDLQLDVNGNTKIVPDAEVQYSWEYILTAVETNVKESAGYLKRIVINKPLAAGTISLFNNGSGASVAMGVITLPGTLLSDGPNSVDYDLAFSSGLTIVTTEAQDITVIYK